MRISSKGRYGLASMIYLGQQEQKSEPTAILTVSEHLGISKIYLEQVFSLLKRAKLVISVKGAGGGYRLSRPAEEITAFDILNAIELSMFEKTEDSVSDSAASLGAVMHKEVFFKLDEAIKRALSDILLSHLVEESRQSLDSDGYMFFI